MVRQLLQDLTEKVATDWRKEASPTGIDLINSIITNPQILWRKAFFNQLNALTVDQKEVVLNWFGQMTSVSN